MIPFFAIPLSLIALLTPRTAAYHRWTKSYVPESITLNTAQLPYQSQRSVDTMCC